MVLITNCMLVIQTTIRIENSTKTFQLFKFLKNAIKKLNKQLKTKPIARNTINKIYLEETFFVLYQKVNEYF